jgi:DMSO reductase family type II enzyme heme b subunit
MCGQLARRFSGGLIVAILVGGESQGQVTTPTAQAAAAMTPGQKLYAQHCAGCHGLLGDGAGPAAAFLFPKPRNFRFGKFRLVSTENSVPSPADLEAVLVRGMPGSSMPPWTHLSRQDRALLIEEVYRLLGEGARDRYVQNLKQEQGLTDEDIKAEDVQAEIAAYAKQRVTPGEVTSVPRIGPADRQAIAQGREHFLKQNCNSCHGLEGKGDGIAKMIEDEGFPTRPRDLTRGIFKGGHDPASLFLRVARGMPGTPMPSAPLLTESQVVELVHYLRSLSTEDERQAAILKREKILVRSVTALPADSAASSWREAVPTQIRLVPLWWRDDAIPMVQVQAVHDGRNIVFRLQWEDPTADTHSGRVEAFKDAAALELVRGTEEPFLGMGSSTTPIDLWMWDADRGMPGGELEDINPRVVVDVYPFTEAAVESAEYARKGTRTSEQAEIALPAKAVGNQISGGPPQPTGGSALTAGGPGSVTFRLAKSQLVTASGRWSQGRWTVLLRRSLSVASPEDGVALAPGQSASVAVAIWEGSHRDRNGQKQVSIWQDLVLEAAR